MSKVKNKAIDILTIILAICLIWMVASFFIGGRKAESVNLFGYRLSYVVSESMEPTIMKNALCLTHIGEKDVNVGDVVVYKHDASDGIPAMLIIHRVISVDKDGAIQTKGDNNAEKDPWTTPKDHIVGRVVGWTNLFAKM